MKNTLFLSLLFQSITLFSQVGINTCTPQGVFHIDGAKNNPTDGTSPSKEQQLDDFIILPNGNIGIGTTVPNAKLEIRSNDGAGFKLIDGSEGEDKMIVSDEQGGSRWKKIGLYKIKGYFGDGVDLILNDESNDIINNRSYYDTGSFIKLPPGKWLVKLQVPVILSTINAASNESLNFGEHVFLRFSFSDTTNFNPMQSNIDINYITPDIDLPNYGLAARNYFGGKIYGPGTLDFNDPKISIVYGELFINNYTNADKTYYLIAGSITKSSKTLKGMIKKAGGAYQGASLYAVPIFVN